MGRNVAYFVDKRYTVRSCIEELRKVGRNVIDLKNGTKIVLPEIGAQEEDQPFSRLKGDNRVMRRIYCRIEPSKKHETKMLDELVQRGYCLYSAREESEVGYSYFGKTEFMLPERVMNEFIRCNGGIDHYNTVTSWSYVLADCMY